MPTTYEAGRLQRIDEDGHATPAVARRYDGAGRLIEHAERTGAIAARSTWRCDAVGRLRERVIDSGTGAVTNETRRCRRVGADKRVDYTP